MRGSISKVEMDVEKEISEPSVAYEESKVEFPAPIVLEEE
jgi:hypothetical protein